MENLITNILTFIGTSILWGLAVWWKLKKMRVDADKSINELEENKKRLAFMKREESKRINKNRMVEIINAIDDSREMKGHQILDVDRYYFKEAINTRYGENIDNDMLSEIYEDLKRDGKIKADMGFGSDYI